MAKTYPPLLSEATLADPKRKAERIVYEKLSKLPDPWEVYYEKGLHGRPHATKADIDREPDFVVVHPDHGFIVLEVKGGTITLDAGEYYSNGIPIQNPFKQARTGKHLLIQSIKNSNRSDGKWIRNAHAVIFPGMPVRQSLSAEAEDYLILSEQELAWIEDALIAIADRAMENQTRETGDGVLLSDIIRRLLAPTISFEVPLGIRIQQHGQEIAALTQMQLRTLRGLMNNNRLAVRGCAGSGKTILAVQMANHLARAGKRTLITCYNQKLADSIAAHIEPGLDITVVHFHQLCRQAARAAGLAIEDRPAPSQAKQVYEIDYPAILKQAVTREPALKYDAILVDEAQDFRKAWWKAIRACLRDPEHGTLSFFYDPEQQLNREESAIPENIFTYELTENLRNTRQIHAALSQFSKNPGEAAGPEGDAVERFSYESPDDLAGRLAALLTKLIDQQKVLPRDIVVLCPLAVEKSPLLGASLGGFKLVKEQPGERDILFSAVQGFKGLDRPVVIFIGLEEQDKVGYYQFLCRFAFSRAVSQLYVAGHASVIEQVFAPAPELVVG